jgi:hypothetical protein
MNPIRHVRRLAAALAGLAGALLGPAAAAPAALASGQPPHPPPGWYKHPPLPAHIQTAAAGGMPGWQIALIAAAAVLLAAALAVIVYRIRAAQRRVTASTAQVLAAAKNAHTMTRRI